MSRYDGAIIDAHHHFWEPSLGKQPWLLPQAKIPFRYEDYSAIKRDYLPPDLLADAKHFKLVGTVTMETEWNLDDPVGEMEYTQQLQQKYGLPNAAVAHAVLRDPQVEATIARLAQFPLVKSIRNKPGQAKTASAASRNPSLLVDDQWQKGYAWLQKYGLHFDLQVAWYHFEEAVALARKFPEQLIIINHAGLPADRSEAALSGWTKAIEMAAKQENMKIKISGIGLPNQPWTLENNGRIIETILENFAPNRAMFASNFPVDSLCGSYDDIFGGFVEMTKDLSPSEQEYLFARTAIETYGLDKDLLKAERASG